MKPAQTAPTRRRTAPALPEWFLEQRMLASIADCEAVGRDDLVRALDRVRDPARPASDRASKGKKMMQSPFPRRTLSALLCASALAASAQAVPATLNYQGRLTDNTPQQASFTGSIYMRFALYDTASGGAPLWQEPAGGGVAVSVSGGVFGVQLGAITPMPAAVFTGGADRWLEITLNPGAGDEQILAPRQKLAAAGYSVMAVRADSALAADSALTAASAQSAADSAALGGVSASGWQRALSAPSCPAGEYLSGFTAAGTPACATPATSVPVPLNLTGTSSSPILWSTQNGLGHGLISSIGATGSPSTAAVYGFHSNAGQAGQFITNAGGYGVYAEGVNGYGLFADVTGTGRAGYFSNGSASNGNPALTGTTAGTGDGIYGYSPANNGVFGRSNSPVDSGVYGESTGGGYGVAGQTTSNSAAAVRGLNHGTGPGVWGWNDGTGAANAGLFQLTNAGATGFALTATTAGSGGGAASFQTQGAANNGLSTLQATNLGLGMAGFFQVNNAGNLGAALWTKSNSAFASVVAEATAPGTRPLIVRGAAGQSGNLQEWQTSGGVALAAVGPSGVFTGNGAGLSNVNAGALGGMASPNWQRALATTACPAGQSYNAIAQDGTAACAAPATPVPLALSGSTSPSGGAILAVNNSGDGGGLDAHARGGIAVKATADDPAAVPVVAQGAVGQAANLQEWRDPSGATLAAVSPAGVFNGNGSGLGALDPAKLAAGVAAISVTGNAATATDATQLGGVAAAEYQRKLSGPACPAGQFYNAIAADGGAGCSAVTTPLDISGGPPSVIKGTQLGASGQALHGVATTTSVAAFVAGVRGEVNGAGSNHYGVWGSGGANGKGVVGDAAGGTGVMGIATAASGVNYGVYGSTNSPSGYGLYTPDRAYAGAGYQQPGAGGETLRMLRGRLASNGAIAAGGGFTAVRGSLGNYTITFTAAFSAAPAVTASAEGGTNACATVTPSAASVTIRTFLCSTNALTDIAFSFIVAGNP